MHKTVLLAFLGLVAASWVSPASAALTCTQRHKVCLDYCETNYKRSPGCTGKCAQALPNCLSTGCWVNGFAKDCGHPKS
jgi:hypothetical protein